MVKESLGPVFPIDVTFVQGEQPNSSKFTGWAAQCSAGLEKLASAIGDAWGENFTANQLFVESTRPANILNLARLIGPASMINPVRQARQTATVTFTHSSLPSEKNEFSIVDDLGCLPPLTITGTWPALEVTVNSSIEAALASRDATAFQTRKTSKVACTSIGDYYVDTAGRVFCYTKTSWDPTGSSTYETDLYPDTYDNATLNVIPDWNQSTSDGLCAIVYKGVEEYELTLPTMKKFQFYDELGNPLEPGDDGVAPEETQALLPIYCRDILGGGDEVPEGFMQLWDCDTNSIVPNLTFTISEYMGGDPTCELKVTGGVLEECIDRYRLITVGNTITEHLAALTHRFDTHGHNGPGSRSISHADLTNLTIDPNQVDSAVGSGGWGFDIRSSPSIIIGNDHPQYLCRYGWEAGVDPGQYDNAMIGHLFMGAERTDYTTLEYNTDFAPSHKIIFGYTAGPYIQYNYNYGVTNDWLSIVGNTDNDIFIYADKIVRLKGDNAIRLYTTTDNVAGLAKKDYITICANSTAAHVVGNNSILLAAGAVGAMSVADNEIMLSAYASIDLRSYGVIDLASINDTTIAAGISGNISLQSGNDIDLQSVSQIDIYGATSIKIHTDLNSSTLATDAILISAGDGYSHTIGTAALLLAAGASGSAQTVEANNMKLYSSQFIQLVATNIYLDTTNYVYADDMIVQSSLSFAANTARLQVPVYSGDPGGPTEGDIWYNTGTNKFMGRNNATSVELG